MRKQKGATFLSWVAGAGLITFMFVTAVKLIPLYLEFYAVRSMVDDIAMEPDMAHASKQQIKGKINDYLNINGLYTLSADAFSVEQVQGKKNVRALEVNYEVRKHWMANIEFLTTFKYSAELGKAGDT
ncbi:MAG: DUF4845 domain-containing protein [Gammaproteobacteria bacterium]|nr:DUF4845 domain-containing protein [Gammaproteobacteria bacterium]MBU1724402.1 DUF4845 domain-containing protein [Gammaproteobacteria bacterium]MBU2004379.1 DUF4845 domain-containing protein [Gammaproteobacteria bacterium]